MKRGCGVRVERAGVDFLGIERDRRGTRAVRCSQMQNLGFCRVFAVLILVSFLIRKGAAGAPTTIHIGALVAFNTSIGNVALRAIQLAVDDVNNDTTTVLPEHQLVLQLSDTNCSAFQGAAAAMDLMSMEVVAVAGPQTSEVAQFVSDMAGATHIPLISFSATDPSLTTASRPKSYFLRSVDSDEVQMLGIAHLVGYFGWRDVVAVSTHNEVGLNGIDILGSALGVGGSTIIYQALLDPSLDQRNIATVLGKLAQLESRVFVVHLEPDIGRMFFLMANSMQMLTSGYVWIVSEPLAIMLDGLAPHDVLSQATQGVIGVRGFVPKSDKLDAFVERWNSQIITPPLTVYGLRAYDSVWMIAYGIQRFLSAGGNFTFVSRPPFPATAGGNSELASLKLLASGPEFLQAIMSVNFTGVSGFVDVNTNDALEHSVYEVVNMVGKGLRTVGYWYNQSSFSQDPPLADSNIPKDSHARQIQSPTLLQDIIWPGGSAQVPRGWVVPKNGKPLLIGVPRKIGYKEFVDSVTDSNNLTTFHGFCIDVFDAAVTYLPYSVSYKFVLYGDGIKTPSYDNLVDNIVDQVDSLLQRVFDAVVGDVTITTKRAKLVDFTQPYTASGLVVVVPVKKGGSSHAWSFMRPFTPLMWCTTGVFFLFTGVVMWILEHKKNRDFRGRPKKQIVTTLWFIFSTLFFSQRENVKSTLGRAVLIIWLFVVLIIISSYTAGLTSILTVQQLMPTIQGIAGLVSSSVPIGYQTGSFVEDYLSQLNVAKERLVPLDTLASYAEALSRGTVGAIVDELPYIQQFLSSECDYTIAGQEFTKGGWGFAFPKGSELAIDMSTAILTLAENGQLQKIHDYWLSSQACSTQGLVVTASELGLSTFWGLFLITGAASVLCVICYYFRLVLQHHRRLKEGEVSDDQLAVQSFRGKSFLRSLAAYIDESEVAEEGKSSRYARKEKRKRSSSFDNSSHDPRKVSADGSKHTGSSQDQKDSLP